MSIRKRDVHFSDWTKVRHALVCNNVQGITETSSFDEVRTFLINSESSLNPFYYYVCYIKETQEIYTHGSFYNCNGYNDSEIKDIIQNIEDDFSEQITTLQNEIEENEKVTAIALTELHANKADKSDLKNIDLSKYVDVDAFNNQIDSFNIYLTSLSEEVEENEEVTAAALSKLNDQKLDASASSQFAKLSDIDNLNNALENIAADLTFSINNVNSLVSSLTTEVEDNEITTAAALVDLHETKVDKSELPDFSEFATKTDLNTKQDLLVSGTNIKTVNNLDITGSGNIETPDTKVTSVENHYKTDGVSAQSTIGFATDVIYDAAGHITGLTARSITESDIPEIDASKISKGTISIDRLPHGALERLYVLTNRTAAMENTEISSGDTIMLTEEDSLMFFCVNDSATTFEEKFKGYTAGAATAVNWSGIIDKPEGIDNWGNRISAIEGTYATQSWIGSNYLSKSGGTIITDSIAGFSIYRNNGGYSAVHFYNTQDGNKIDVGYLGAASDGRPVYINAGGGVMDLIHSGNIGQQIVSRAASAGEADSADVLKKSFANEDINYGNGDGLKLIYCHSNQGNFASGWQSGISVLTDYTGWQLTSYGGDVENPYFRSLQDNGVWKPWRQLAFLDSDVLSPSSGLLTINGNAAISGILTMSDNTNSAICFGSYWYLQRINNTIALGLGYTNSLKVNDVGDVEVAGNIEGGIFGLRNSSPDNPLLRLTVDNQNYYVQATSDGIYLGSTSTLSLKVDANGNTTINGVLGVSGGISSSANMYAPDFCTTSDSRLKDFTKDVEIDFENLKNIPKKYYYWKDKSMGKNLQIGTSAQELMKVYPTCVYYNEEEDKYSVNYQKLSIVALAAIDKLHDRVKYLESKIND